MLGGVSPIWGKGVGGVDPHRCPPFKRSSKPSWILKKTCAGRQPAAGSATLCRSRHTQPPRPASLLDSLPIAVSLALLPVLAAAAAGSAAGAPVPGAAGLADLADLAAVLQRGAGVCPLQAVVLQELGLERSQVLLATLDLCSQQHDVGAVTRFL